MSYVIFTSKYKQCMCLSKHKRCTVNYSFSIFIIEIYFVYTTTSTKILTQPNKEYILQLS